MLFKKKMIAEFLIVKTYAMNSSLMEQKNLQMLTEWNKIYAKYIFFS